MISVLELTSGALHTFCPNKQSDLDSIRFPVEKRRLRTGLVFLKIIDRTTHRQTLSNKVALYRPPVARRPGSFPISPR